MEETYSFKTTHIQAPVTEVVLKHAVKQLSPLRVQRTRLGSEDGCHSCGLAHPPGHRPTDLMGSSLSGKSAHCPKTGITILKTSLCLPPFFLDRNEESVQHHWLQTDVLGWADSHIITNETLSQQWVRLHIHQGFRCGFMCMQIQRLCSVNLPDRKDRYWKC